MTEDSPAVRRAHELAHLIHTGDRAAARAYVEQHYAPDLLRIPMARHSGIISHLHDQTRGVAVLAVHRAEPATATLLIRGELTGIVQGLVVQVEASSPFRVTSIFLEDFPQTAAGQPVALLAAASLPGELAAWLQPLAEADYFPAPWRWPKTASCCSRRPTARPTRTSPSRIRLRRPSISAR